MPDFRNRKRVKTKAQGRQKVNIKLTTRLAVAALLLIASAIFLVWQLQRPEVLKADRQPGMPVGISNPEYITDMSLPEPVVTHTAIDPKTIQYRLPSDPGNNQ